MLLTRAEGPAVNSHPVRRCEKIGVALQIKCRTFGPRFMRLAEPRPDETVSKPYKTCADGLIARRGRGSARTTVQAVSFSDLVTCYRSLTCRHRILRKSPIHNFGGKLSFETVSDGRAYSLSALKAST